VRSRSFGVNRRSGFIIGRGALGAVAAIAMGVPLDGDLADAVDVGGMTGLALTAVLAFVCVLVLE